ncbi:MAG TPA: ATP synthase F0 subunit B [Terracidiphilus sp.]|nr:ATP synthase F0 subunit B [Terracidiphilus sp.]
MHEIFQELGALFLASAPTALLFLVLVVCYQFLVQKPLTATLKERRARTDGAMQEAGQAIAEAEARAAEYAEKLRQARAELMKARDLRLKQWNAERDAAVEAARKSAGERVAGARADVEAEAAKARQTIQGSAAELASQVVRAVMPASAGGSR